jgi:hypothetical protein
MFQIHDNINIRGYGGGGGETILGTNCKSNVFAHTGINFTWTIFLKCSD